jgi:hypothetical protein
MKSGEYVVQVSIMDGDTNREIQWLSSRVFLNRTGSGGKGYYSVATAQAYRTNNTTYAQLIGNFPSNGVVHTLVGIPRYGWSQGSMVANQTGTELVFAIDQLAEPGYQGSQRAADVVLCFQSSECQTLSKTFWFKDQPPTAIAVQQQK